MNRHCPTHLNTMNICTKRYPDTSLWAKMVDWPTDWHCNPKSHAASVAKNQSVLNQYNNKNKPAQYRTKWLGNHLARINLLNWVKWSSPYWNSGFQLGRLKGVCFMRLLAKLHLKRPLSICSDLNRQRQDKCYRTRAKQTPSRQPQNILE